MKDKVHLVTSGTAGGWSGSVGSLDNPVQQIPEGYQIREGSYNAGAHYGFRLNPSISKHYRWIRPYMRKSQSGKIIGNGNIELSVANNFWNAIRVSYLGLLRFVGHRYFSLLSSSFLCRLPLLKQFYHVGHFPKASTLRQRPLLA